MEGNLFWVPLAVTQHLLAKDTASLPGFTFFAVQATAITNSWLNSKLTCWAVSTSVGNLASRLIISQAGRLESIPRSVGKHSLMGRSLSQWLSPNLKWYFSHQEAKMAEEHVGWLRGELPRTVHSTWWEVGGTSAWERISRCA